MNEDKKSEFEYTYFAPCEHERKQIESIRQSYLDKIQEASKLEKLTALDKKAKALPKAVSISLGIAATLVFGLGLSMITQWGLVISGSVICAVGILAAAFNYPIYLKLRKCAKLKYGAEILNLSDELLNEDKKK